MKKVTKIKGFTDLYSPDSDRFTRMEAVARDVFSRYGFTELRTPVMERTELFARGIGEETDVVQKEMYTFPDRKNRMMTLRPEATAGLVRSYIESGGHAPGKVGKYYSFGPMFRYERPQKGRQRQFHQIDAEIFGAPEPGADAELILMLNTYLRELGIKGVAFEINSLGCPECRPRFRQALTDYFLAQDKEKFCEDCQRRMTTNPLRVLDCKVPACKEMTEGAPSIQDHLCQECEEHFAAVMGVVEAAGIEHEVNPRLVRGLDYYQRTTFEVVAQGIGAQSSVAGGGRYDGLFKDLGGPDIPGTGFACGMERLAFLMPEAEPHAPDFYLAVLDKRGEGLAVSMAQRLREMGFSGQISYGAGSMKSRLRQANKTGAAHCLILGGDEIDQGTVTVKDMKDGGEQKTLAFEDYISSISKG